jgi:small subunit ribosomal protein S2
MGSLPGAIFVIDPAMETIAVNEANKIGLPVIAITDTNCDPDKVNYVIPGNDDAIRSIKLITARIADAVVEGSQRRKETVGREETHGGRRGDGPQAEIIRGGRPRRDDADRPS